MSSDILNNLNPGIENLHPYEPGRSIDEVVTEFGHSEVVKLASNENPLGASPKALAILSELESDMHLYPDGNGTKLKKEIANHENVPFDKICPCVCAIVVISSLSKFITFCDLDSALLNFK